MLSCSSYLELCNLDRKQCFQEHSFISLLKIKPLKAKGWRGKDRGREGIKWCLCSCFVKMSLEINPQGKAIVGQPVAFQEPSLVLQVGGSSPTADGATGKRAKTLPGARPSPRAGGERLAGARLFVNPTGLCQGWKGRGWPATTPDHSPAEGHASGRRPRDISRGQQGPVASLLMALSSLPQTASGTDLKPLG